jgi:hypothetical protein
VQRNKWLHRKSKQIRVLLPMAPPPSSLLRDLLAADGFKNRRRSKPPHDNSAPVASRNMSMPLQHRHQGKPVRSQSDVLTTRSRLRNGGSDNGSNDAAGDEQRAATTRRRSSSLVARATSYSDKGNGDSGLKRVSAKLHETASGVPYPRLAACAHLYMSAVSTLQRRGHSAAVHELEAFCLAPSEARTALLPALWDRLFRPGLAHLRTWRECEAAEVSSSDGRVKEVEKVFADALDEGTRVLYRDWLLGRTDAMALPDVPAPPSTVPAGSGRVRCSTSTSYDIGSDVFFTSGSLSPGKVMSDGRMRRSGEIEEEEEEVHVETARDGEEVRFKVHVNCVFH